MHRIRALGAIIALAVLVIGFPLGLGLTVGNPVHAVPAIKAGDMSDTSLIAIMGTVAYLAWAQFAYAVLVELVSALRRSPVPRRIPFVLAGQQNLARTLVSTAILLGTVATAAGIPTNAFAAPAPARAPAATAAAVRRPASPPARPDTAPTRTSAAAAAAQPHGEATPAPQPQPTVYLVPASGGESTLWALAVKHYGAGEQWTKIWAINKDRRQADGAVMTTPGLLRPGWTVLIPADATAPAAPGRHAEPASTVTVHRGDTLSGIAERRGSMDWHTLWDENKDRGEPHGRTFDNPDMILPGWQLTIPATGGSHVAPPPHKPAPAPRVHPQPTQQRAPARPHPHPATPAPSPSLPAPHPHETVPGATVPQTAPRPVHAAAQPTKAADRSAHQGAVLVEVLGSGVGLLAAGALAVLLTHRRRQFRRRAPGRAVAAAPPDLTRVEQALKTFGEPALAHVAFLDAALRTLCLSGEELPDVIAARVTASELSLVFTDPPASSAPAPWRDDAGRWVIDRAASLPAQAADGDDRPVAPYPCLVSVGVADDGAEWLLDLERTQTLTLTGDQARGLDLARYLAAELAANKWSDHLVVTLAGFGAELTAANTARVAFSGDVVATAAHLLRDLDANVAAAAAAGVDVLAGRRGGRAADVWMPHVLLASASTPADTAALDQLASRCAAYPGRTAVAVVMQSPQDATDAAGQVAHIDDRGQLHLPFLDVTLRAQQLPQWLAADMAAAIAVARDGDVDMAIPPATNTRDGGEFLDACGAVQAAHTTPRVVVSDASGEAAPLSPTSTLLPAPVAHYLTATATTADDVAALSPIVPDHVQAAVAVGDPTLDADLAAWRDPASRIARLTLFDEVEVTAFGRQPDKTRPFYTEVVGYLALHPTGVSPEQFAADLWPHKSYTATTNLPRQVASTVRHWLGDHPVTGKPYLARAVGGVDRYGVDGLLVDVDLFRRLRARGQARGAAGVADLAAALTLVTGPPLHKKRPNGWTWLPPGEQDLYLAMVVDVAHIVATDALANDDLPTAETAARAALRAGDTGDIALLDLVAVCDAAGRNAEASAYVQRVLDNHDAEVEEDLPPRTYQVLRRREWLPAAS